MDNLKRISNITIQREILAISSLIYFIVTNKFRNLKPIKTDTAVGLGTSILF
jgi:hypothetical protein